VRGRLPDTLFRLKMGTPPERRRYQQIRSLFAGSPRAGH
jgi:hypothetical protein